MQTERISLRIVSDDLARATGAAADAGIDRSTLLRIGLDRVLSKPPTAREVARHHIPAGRKPPEK